ncbi:MAG: thermonuclease family protein [Planctomycetota bacterium]|jgi:micrococcal nuclease
MGSLRFDWLGRFGRLSGLVALLVLLGGDAVHARRSPAPRVLADAWAEVIEVVDGDTIKVRLYGRTRKVRLLRVNTPERYRRGYRTATRALERAVGRRGNIIHLEFERPGPLKTDMFGRVLAYVYTSRGSVNEGLIRRGLSPFFTRYGEGRHAARFRAAERHARTNDLGLWGAGNLP